MDAASPLPICKMNSIVEPASAMRRSSSRPQRKVLRVISSSPGDLQLVFATILENAVRVCEAKFGALYLNEGDGFRAMAMHNAPPAYEEARARVVHPPTISSLCVRRQQSKPSGRRRDVGTRLCRARSICRLPSHSAVNAVSSAYRCSTKTS